MNSAARRRDSSTMDYERWSARSRSRRSKISGPSRKPSSTSAASSLAILPRSFPWRASAPDHSFHPLPFHSATLHGRLLHWSPVDYPLASRLHLRPCLFVLSSLHGIDVTLHFCVGTCNFQCIYSEQMQQHSIPVLVFSKRWRSIPWT